MKKLILLAIVSTIGLSTLNAQNFFQGDKSIAAKVSNLDLGIFKANGQKAEGKFNFGFKGDYFVIDDLTITAGLYYDNTYGDNSLWGEIGSKYYFWQYIYGGIFYQGLYDYKRLNSAGKIEVGATLYITDHVFIEPAVYFLRGERSIAVKTVEMFSQFGLSVSFGVSF